MGEIEDMNMVPNVWIYFSKNKRFSKYSKGSYQQKAIIPIRRF